MRTYYVFLADTQFVPIDASWFTENSNGTLIFWAPKEEDKNEAEVVAEIYRSVGWCLQKPKV